jgi:hypothetical protein
MYEWLLIPPDYERINDQVYIDDQLNDLITDYNKIQKKSKIEFEIRKNALQKNKHGKIPMIGTGCEDNEIL